MTELWKPWAKVLQMLCHHAKHGRKRTPRQLSDATWEIGDDALPRHRLFDFSLYLSFQLHRQTALCLPCSAGLVLILARENVLAGKWWQEKGRGTASAGCQREKFLVHMMHTKSKNSSLWLNRLFVWLEQNTKTPSANNTHYQKANNSSFLWRNRDQPCQYHSNWCFIST